MADPRDRSQQQWSARSVLVALAVAALAMPLLFWAWVFAWLSVPDPSQQERTAYLNKLLDRGGVAARLQRGRMVTLRRGDVTVVGASTCARAYSCMKSGRSGCWDVAVTFTCTYDVKDRTGNPATAILVASRNHFYELLAQDAWRREPYLPQELGLNEADDKLCQLGYGCRPPGGQDEPWNPQDTAPQSSETRPPASDVAAMDAATTRPSANCPGVTALVIGKGTVCLDPSAPKQREFRDCVGSFCGPLMVALPRGGYQQFGEQGSRDARPRREVSIDHHLAVGKFEVTFTEWDVCAADGGCFHKPGDNQWGRGPRPVINVSFEQITKEYLPWLNRKLGLAGANAYRLPTGDEWEYAARSVTSSAAPHTRYAWGDEIGANRANCAGCGSVWDAWKTAPVGSFAPNPFGLHDMHGNVEEWTEDCRAASPSVTRVAPMDGECVTRGGSWSSVPHVISFLQWKVWTFSISYGADRGFRVARTLTTSP